MNTTMMAKKGTLTLKAPSFLQKKPAAKAAPAPVKKAAPKNPFSRPPAKKAAPAKKQASAPGRGSAAERQLWFPAAEPPAWLDGSMIGDRGFDPLGLAKPAEYLQFDLDQLDQNGFDQKSGNVIGKLIPNNTTVSTDSLQVGRLNHPFGFSRISEAGRARVRAVWRVDAYVVASGWTAMTTHAH